MTFGSTRGLVPVEPVEEAVTESLTEPVTQQPAAADVQRSEHAAAEMVLVRRAAGGDLAAAHTLVDRYSQKLFGLAQRLTGNASDAEDVLQETFAGALRGLGSFEGRSSVKTWLTRILVTQVARWRRSERVRKTVRIDGEEAQQSDRLADPGVISPDHARSAGQRLDLTAAIETLSAEHKEVIMLREYQGLSYEEIAQVLGVPRGTVESRLHRARAELREKLKDYRR